MKMKSLLLGSAAGIVAVTGAQAADLPLAEPVEYVQICDTYGAGFFYIPGTNTCLKIGGYVRVDYNIGALEDSTVRRGAFFDSIEGPPSATLGTVSGDANIDEDETFAYIRTSRLDDKSNDNLYSWFARGAINFDVRTETEFGTLRAFVQYFGNFTSTSDAAQPVLADKAFVQLAGFTFGLTQSFFDAPYASYVQPYVSEDTTTNVLAYTATFGNGFSATLSMEDGVQRRGIATSSLIAIETGDFGRQAYAGTRWPDLVAALRVSQGWGSFQLSGALHQNRVRDELDTGALGNTAFEEFDEDWGYAVQANLRVNVPMIGNNSFVWANAAYGEGAHSYVTGGGPKQGLASLGFNPWYTVADVYANYDDFGSDGVDQGKAWSLTGGASVGIMPGITLRGTASYARFDDLYWIGGGEDINGSIGSIDAFQGVLGAIWTPVAGLDIGLEVVYDRLDVNLSGSGIDQLEDVFGEDPSDGLGRMSGAEDAWTGRLRVQRNF